MRDCVETHYRFHTGLQYEHTYTDANGEEETIVSELMLTCAISVANEAADVPGMAEAVYTQFIQAVHRLPTYPELMEQYNIVTAPEHAPPTIPHDGA